MMKISDEEKLIARRVRSARREVGLTQEELARRVGVAQNTISKYEIGIRHLSAMMLFRIAQVLELPLDYFFEPLSNAEDASKSPSGDTP